MRHPVGQRVPAVDYCAMAKEPGHTIQIGIAGGCPVCTGFGLANGNPAHAATFSEDRILRAVAAMLSTERASPIGMKPTLSDKDHAARLLQVGRNALNHDSGPSASESAS